MDWTTRLLFAVFRFGNYLWRDFDPVLTVTQRSNGHVYTAQGWGKPERIHLEELS